MARAHPRRNASNSITRSKTRAPALSPAETRRNPTDILLFSIPFLARRHGAGRRRAFIGVAALVAIVAVACGTDSGNSQPAAPSVTNDPTGSRAFTVVPSATPTPSPDGGDQSPGDGLSAVERAFWSRAAAQGWTTDFTRIVDDLDVRDILSGGVPRDGIPSIDNPRFAPVGEAPDYLRSDEPVVVLELNGAQRAYPLSILTWHEIVNDVINGTPIVVTFCPLCNTSLTFLSTLPDGRVLDFGVSGNLRNRDLILYDAHNDLPYIIGEFYTPPDLGKHNRCDLHPRWSPDNKSVSIDSTHEGSRQQYIVDVSDFTA